MDAPENTGSRIGRTIWTVWGYLSGAVARYLRPEVTDKGNQSVNSRSDEAAVNKTDKEVKAESSENQHDKSTAEIKVCSPDVKAQVQWENTDVVKDDSNDELNVDITKKQTYRFAMWSTGTESISVDAHAEKETAKSECKESDATHGLEEIGQTEQEDAKNKECDWNNQDEKCVRTDKLDHADMLVQSEFRKQDEKPDHGENEVIGGLKRADTTEVEFVHQHNKEMIEKDVEKVQDLPPLLEYCKEEADGLSKPEMLNLLDAYSDEIDEFSKNEVDHMGPGTEGANEQDKESETSHNIKQTGKTEQEDANNKEYDWNNQVEKCVMKEEIDDADILVQSELQEQDEKTDHGEKEVIEVLKHADTNEVEFADEEMIENDEERVRDLPPLLEYRKEEADGLSKPETLNLLDAYSDEIHEFSKNEVDQVGPGTDVIKQTGKTEQEESKNKECDWNNQVEECVMTDKLDHADILVQSELQKQVEEPDHGENEVIGGLKHTDTNEVEFVQQNNEEMTENDEEKVQDLPPLLEYRTDDLPMPEKLNLLDTCSDEIDEFPKNEVDQVGLAPKGATEQYKDSETSHMIKQTGKVEQDDQHHEDKKCMMKEDPGYTSLTVQSELEKQMDMKNHEESESIAGFKEAGEHVIEHLIGQNDQEKNEEDKEKALKLQSEVQDSFQLLEYSSKDTLQNPEKLNLMQTYCSEIAENVVEDMLLASEKDEDMTESEHKPTTSQLHESTETLHGVSNEIPKKHKPNNEMELKMITVLGECFETVNTSENTMLSDSKQDTPENTTETGTGSPVVAVTTEGMFSDVIVCDFPGELRKEPETSSTPAHYEENKFYLNELQSFSERHLERDAKFACTVERSETMKPAEKVFEIEKDIETLIESLDATERQEIDKNKLSLMEDVKLSTKLMSEHEKAESFETEITLESRELLEFTRGECKSSHDTMVDTLSESDGSAKVEQVADVDSILTRYSPPSEFVEETLGLPGESERFIEEQEILETDLVKTALDYVEEITNQVLKEMIETEMLEKTEHLVELSMEELGDAECRGTENSVSAEAFVLEEERMILDETMESNVEMEVETASNEDFKQNEQHTSSPKLETCEAERHHEEQTYHCVKLSTGTDYLETNQGDTDTDEHKVDDAHVENEEASSEREYANVVCKDSEKNWWTEQKDGLDVKCSMAMKKEDPDNTDMVQSELHGEDLDEYKQINMVDLETEGTGGLKFSDKLLTDEKEKNVDQNDQENPEDDENQQPEVEAPADAFVLEEEIILVGETMDGKVEMEVETTSSEDVKQNQQHTNTPKLETSEVERHHEEQTYHCTKLSTGTDYLGTNPDDSDIDEHKDDDAHVENEEASSEIEYANTVSKDSESAQELEKDWQIEQKDDDNKKCTILIKKEDPENADMVQSELHEEDVEQNKQIIMVNLEEAEGTGGLRHSDKHFTYDKEKNIDQNHQEKPEDDQQPEGQEPADAFIMEEEMMLLVETMDGNVEIEVETTCIEDVELMCEADGGHEKIQKVIAGETLLRGHKDAMEVSKPAMKRRFGQVNKDPPEVKIQGIGFNLQDSSLDFTIQKSRIAVKNPLVRPPKDPRKLISKASVEPLLPQPSACSPRVNVSPLNKGMIGFKLPGLGSGMPVLKKTEFGKKAREGEAEKTLQPQQKSDAEPEDSDKPVQTTAKPKWTPPRHPGMGGPLMMAELKNKLKKPSNQ
ncbi:uncharacterized protein si:ch211-136m16.8 [Danio aesculapii]|uniref:uncharacterized protein si:ch211-136m16.8 n=1 Tax=Danio aesculapii TaxID=1142201 RepID=UPI0024C04BD8|nr:uncharacterized protein si:ch211-136m16.8 [Danio aesculapii]